jgi:hypothetical protein
MAKLSDAARIRAYFIKHPKAKPAEAVKALGVKPANVYVVRNKMRNPVTKIILNEALPLLEKTLAEKQAAPATITVAPAVDMVNNPPHYVTGGVEVIDFIDAKGLDYHLGNVVKYVARSDKKGNVLEDLKKARWYLNRAIAAREVALTTGGSV